MKVWRDGERVSLGPSFPNGQGFQMPVYLEVYSILLGFIHYSTFPPLCELPLHGKVV